MVSFYRQARPQVRPEEFETTCEELDLKGQGVCRHAGRICFVSGVMPGEQVRVRGVLKDRGEGNLRLVSILKVSPQRRDPDCPYQDRCGGCSLQHVPPTLALESKVRGLMRLYAKTCRQQLPPPPQAVVESPEFGYRRAARLAVRFDRGQLYLGFRKEGSHEVCDLEHCPTLTERLNAVLPALRACLSTLPQRGKIGHVELLDSDGGVGVSIRYVAEPKPADLELLTAFAHKTQATVWVSTSVAQAGYSSGPDDAQRVTERCIAGEEQRVYLNCGSQQLGCTPGSFVQVNPTVNHSLVELAGAWLQSSDGTRVLDLFCGLGNFSFPLAERGAQVVGVDVGAQMINKAQLHAQAHGLNARFYAADLEADFQRESWASATYDQVILDPGRKGADRACSYVLKRRIPTVLMISCNPTVGMRDVRSLLEGGYRLLRWGVLDMFPRTAHVETVALMSRVEK